MSIFDKVERFIIDNNMILPGDCVTVGVSGGADSMCLLFLLQKYCARLNEKGGNIQLQVVHINHGIRGNSADRDADFVRQYCEREKIPCYIKCVNVPEIARQRHESVEEAGRNIRYAAFREYGRNAVKTGGLSGRSIIAVAGHMNDQAETILHNIFRGTGLRGLSGMNPVEGDIIRPFLCIRRDEIERMAKENGILFITDETNSDIHYTRNRIRHTIIPEAEQVNTCAVENISKMSGKMRRVWELVNRLSIQAYEKYSIRENGEILLDMGVFGEDEIIVDEVIRRIINNLAGRLKDVTSDNIEDVKKLIDRQSGKEVHLPYAIIARRQYDRLVFFKTGIHAAGSDDSRWRMEKKILEKGEFEGLSYPVDTYTKWFDYDKINNGLTLRTRRSGDFINLRFGRKKLKEYFIDRKVDERKRDCIPVVADGDEILWIVGYRMSERYKVTENTQKVMEISIIEASSRKRFGMENHYEE